MRYNPYLPIPAARRLGATRYDVFRLVLARLRLKVRL